MNWTEQRIRDIITDMTAENPMACRSLLEISEIQFTENVPTMAVTLSGTPTLKINMTFCREHLTCENDVKCVLLHEFLHVLLMHTSIYKECNPLLNVSLDAIINAIIWRTMGAAYADFFKRFYAPTPPTILLRHIDPYESAYHFLPDNWKAIHKLIYSKGYCADDLYELLTELKNRHQKYDWSTVVVLGNHEPEVIGESAQQVLNDIMNKMTGVDIWRKFEHPGNSDEARNQDRQLRQFRMNRWKQAATELIRKCVVAKNKMALKHKHTYVAMPLLSASDRRAFLRFRAGGIIPQSTHELTHILHQEQATVYLDVSGSMDGELDALAALLHQLREWIRLPLLTFSNNVSVAKFKNGKLFFDTTGGTSISCVFNHIRRNRIQKAMIITDGFLGKMPEEMTAGIEKSKIHFLLTSQHHETDIADARFPYRALPPIDWDTGNTSNSNLSNP